MRRRDRRAWSQQLRSLGASVLALLEAELAALRQDLQESGRRLAVSLALLAVGALFVVWSLWVLTQAAVEGLALVLPHWGAHLVVAGVLLLIAATLAGVGYFRLRFLEPPTETVRRRYRDHLRFWREEALAPGEGGGPSLAAGAKEPEEEPEA